MHAWMVLSRSGISQSILTSSLPYADDSHNETALALKARLLFRPNTVVTSVPTLVD
jgi:hypothetical protein